LVFSSVKKLAAETAAFLLDKLAAAGRLVGKSLVEH
jgi:hypothetical protein